jgi:hypothetical protein
VVLDVADFQAITDSALKRFDEQVATVDREVEIEVAQLESQVVQLYGIAALLVQRETELEIIAGIWNAMIVVCDAVAQKIQSLADTSDLRSASRDRVLDIRNKSTRLRDLHGG